MSEVKEWIKTSHAPGGGLVTVTLVAGNYTAKWSVKFHAGMPGAVKKAVADARKHAHGMLDELLIAVKELDAEEADAA